MVSAVDVNKFLCRFLKITGPFLVWLEGRFGLELRSGFGYIVSNQYSVYISLILVHLFLVSAKYAGDKAEFIEAIRQALYASKIVSYAQGFMLMKEAAKEYNWNLNYGGIALMWRGGCIIKRYIV